MLTVEPFRPAPSGTVNISATTSNGTATLNATVANNISVRIHNGGPSTVFVEFGGLSTVAATTATGMPVPVGAIEVINIDQCAYAAAITSSGTASVYFTKGYGL